MQKKHKEGFEVFGPEREEALGRIQAQLDEWGLVMPDDDPLMLHFGVNDFYSIGETEFWICNDTKQGYCWKYMFLFDGQRCPNHHHKIKHETFNVVKGTIMMSVDGTDHRLESGRVFRMPVETSHTFAAVDGSALVLEVSKPCLYQDSHFSSPDIEIF